MHIINEKERTVTIKIFLLVLHLICYLHNKEKEKYTITKNMRNIVNGMNEQHKDYIRHKH